MIGPFKLFQVDEEEVRAWSSEGAGVGTWWSRITMRFIRRVLRQEVVRRQAVLPFAVFSFSKLVVAKSAYWQASPWPQVEQAV